MYKCLYYFCEPGSERTSILSEAEISSVLAEL